MAKGSKATLDSNQLVSYATIVSMLLIMSLVPGHSCSEQDANIVRPLASLVKSMVSAVTTGVPQPIDFNAFGLARDLAGLSLRTGFPVTMPRGFSQAAREFFDRVRSQVEEADVKKLPRKRLVQLKDDIDAIVDALVDEVRLSPDGLYTNYLATQVNGKSLEEALVEVGSQLKAYGMDLIQYRDLAGTVLGMPLLPTLASHANQAAGAARRPVETVASLPNSVMGAAQQLGSSIESSLRGYVPPLPIFGRSQAAQAAA